MAAVLHLHYFAAVVQVRLYSNNPKFGGANGPDVPGVQRDASPFVARSQIVQNKLRDPSEKLDTRGTIADGMPAPGKDHQRRGIAIAVDQFIEDF